MLIIYVRTRCEVFLHVLDTTEASLYKIIESQSYLADQNPVFKVGNNKWHKICSNILFEPKYERQFDSHLIQGLFTTIFLNKIAIGTTFAMHCIQFFVSIFFMSHRNVKY